MPIGTPAAVPPRRALPVLLAALLVALVPLATLAANPFTDLTGSPHNANIDAIFNAGSTTGCGPGVAHCPNGSVTREEMASVLARTAGLGGSPPVASALTAQTATSAQTAANTPNAQTTTTATSATNARIGSGGCILGSCRDNVSRIIARLCASRRHHPDRERCGGMSAVPEGGHGCSLR